MENYKKAVLYARFSSNNQREESIDAQLRAMREFCEKENIEIINEYTDYAKSGTNDRREGFLNMIEDSSSGTFDYVIVHKLDRFSRNKIDMAIYLQKLKKNKVKLLSVLERIGDEPEGVILLSVLEGMSEYYSLNLAREVKKGLRETALAGKWTGGTPPLGYDVVNQKLVINEHEAKAVRLIFEMSDKGYGYKSIIKQLNLLGYKTKKGREFGKNSIYEILINERYKGVYIYNKRASSSEIGGKRNNHSYKSSDEVIIIEGGCPCIVSKELWDRVNATRKAVNNKCNNANHIYLLTGLLYCSCGAKFHGDVKTYKKRKHIYYTYRCSARVSKGTCKQKEIRCEILDLWVIEQFFQYFFSKQSISHITEQLNERIKSLNEDNEDYKSAKLNLESRIKKRNNLVDYLMNYGANESVNNKLKDCEEEIRELEQYLAIYRENHDNIILGESDVEREINALKEALANGENAQRMKYILSQYIERIEISEAEVKAIFKVAFPFGDLKAEINQVYNISRKRLMKEYADDNTINMDVRMFLMDYNDSYEITSVHRKNGKIEYKTPLLIPYDIARQELQRG